jgi:hypothetical protein
MTIDLYISRPSGIVPLEGESEELLLPEDSSTGACRISYGKYLRSVAGYLSANSFRSVRKLLAGLPDFPRRLQSAKNIELISEKHGALYSVSRLAIHFPDGVLSFAVNTAFSAEQQAFLQLEYRLLRNLSDKFGLPFLPRPFLSGKLNMEGLDRPARLFIAEWFENHHEFHLSAIRAADSAERIVVWNRDVKPFFLNSYQATELYALASRILTLCLDTRSFRQIYPWHHAAGDFIVDETRDPVSVRLITARGYRSLLPQKSDANEKMLGSLHFFLNLSIRMRIDRLDGTGELAWAGPDESLAGLIRGFSQAWEKKVLEDDELPEAADIFGLFLQFSLQERLAFAEVAARDGRIEAGEEDFLAARLPAHVQELSEAMRRGIG